MNPKNRNPKAAKPVPAARTSQFTFLLVLAAILAILFCKSFLPGYVHFSNDGPLGEQNTAWSRLPAAFTGSWDDLNDIGMSVGANSPDVTALIFWSLGPVGFSKFLAPIALFILGAGAWTFFRQLKLSPLAAGLGALATALNSCYVGNACWGTAPQQIAMAMVFFALALVMANSDETPRLIRWARLILAGMCVGVSVMEGADNGAIFSLFVAAYVFFKSLLEENKPALVKIGRGIGRVAVIAIFALFIAAQTVSSLVGTFIVGTAGMEKGDQTMSPQQHWDWATQWSLPKRETLGVFVPGIFGYGPTTPKFMMDFLQDSYQGGEYWGAMARDPAIDRFYDSGTSGPPPQGMMRFGYAGYYCGILVALVALFAMAQSLRKQNSIFPPVQKRMIWFWMAALVIALLLSWGRFAPFYYFLYKLPYFSTIRSPAKFMAIFYLAMAIIFAYGVDALSRRYLVASNKVNTLKAWWASVRGFDRNWTIFSLVAFVISVVAWLVYASQKTALVQYLQEVGFPDEETAKQIAAFSVGQAGWFLLFFAAAVVLVILVLAGVFAGKRARLGGFLLGALLMADLGRANLPWIIHWNYKQKYASNDIIDLLRDKPYEHRVAYLLPPPLSTPQQFGLFENLYNIEWMQHHFPYYNIQCLDKIQQPRMPADLQAYENALQFKIKQDSSGREMLDPDSLPLRTRLWELTNTRFLLGPAPALDEINRIFDPVLHRFRIYQAFNVAPKLGVDVDKLQRGLERGIFYGEWLDATPDNNGEYALFEFTGALPRAKLYSNWQVNTNDADVLQALANPNFDPQKTVLVSTPPAGEPMTNSAAGNPGTVDFAGYSPKDIVIKAQAAAPSVLLLNDKFDPGWNVFVDGAPAQLLRCNFIMRGVFLSPGSHTVEFKFGLPHKPLFITASAMGIGVLLCAFLFFSTRKPPIDAKKI